MITSDDDCDKDKDMLDMYMADMDMVGMNMLDLVDMDVVDMMDMDMIIPSAHDPGVSGKGFLAPGNGKGN